MAGVSCADEADERQYTGDKCVKELFVPLKRTGKYDYGFTYGMKSKEKS